jgi:hypothetical protein
VKTILLFAIHFWKGNKSISFTTKQQRYFFGPDLAKIIIIIREYSIILQCFPAEYDDQIQLEETNHPHTHNIYEVFKKLQLYEEKFTKDVQLKKGKHTNVNSKLKDLIRNKEITTLFYIRKLENFPI